MAIKILGHNPEMKNDRRYQEEIAKRELINFADLFDGIAVRPTAKVLAIDLHGTRRRIRHKTLVMQLLRETAA